jgi:regulator of cell morphogenesis and NO signaling
MTVVMASAPTKRRIERLGAGVLARRALPTAATPERSRIAHDQEGRFMNVSLESRIGEIAARHPLATRVFARHGIDFCCGGGVPLADACAKRGLDATAVVDEIKRTLASSDPESQPNWSEATPAELVRHILDRYHAPLREELPRLEAMARKVYRVHGEKDPERLRELLETLLRLEAEIVEHLRDEEESLFPAIVAGGDAAGISASDTPLAGLIDDHSRVGAGLSRLRELTDGYRVPEEACNTWRALWHGLEALETDLHEHIHLENNVLFPRVAAA